MQIRVRNDSVEIEGYVNAVERNSKPLASRSEGKFIERICKGAFKNALKRNDDVAVLLNHDWHRTLGSTKQGNLELEENNIGLHARAIITDKELVEKARNGDLIGWSFGFADREVERTKQDDVTLRAVKDLDLYEVSILDRTKSPAYEGTLINTRTQEMYFRGEDFIDDVKLTVEPQKSNEVQSTPKEERTEAKTTPTAEKKPIDYSKYEKIIKEMKEGFRWTKKF